MPISNKKYEKFWENNDLDVSANVDNTKTNIEKVEEDTKKEVLETKKVADKPKTTKKKKPIKKIEATKKTETKKVETKKVETKKVETKIIEPIVVNKSVEMSKTITKNKPTKKVETKIIELIEEDIVEEIKNEEKLIDVVVKDGDIESIINDENPIVKIDQVIKESKDTIATVEIQEVVKVTVDEVKQPSMKEVYNSFLTEQKPFRIFHRGIEIFNTNKQIKKDFPVFQHDGFLLFGKKYTYRGIRIEKI